MLLHLHHVLLHLLCHLTLHLKIHLLHLRVGNHEATGISGVQSRWCKCRMDARLGRDETWRTMCSDRTRRWSRLLDGCKG